MSHSKTLIYGLPDILKLLFKMIKIDLNCLKFLNIIGLLRYLEEIFNTKEDVISKPSLKEELKQHILKEVIYK